MSHLLAFFAATTFPCQTAWYTLPKEPSPIFFPIFTSSMHRTFCTLPSDPLTRIELFSGKTCSSCPPYPPYDGFWRLCISPCLTSGFWSSAAAGGPIPCVLSAAAAAHSLG